MPSPGCLPDGTRRAALRAGRDGALSKAARVLSQEQHPLSANVHSSLASLHPPSLAAGIPDLGPPPVGDDFSVEEVLECLRSFPPGSSGGISGLMPQHLRCPKPDGAFQRQLLQLARVCSEFTWGRLSKPASEALASARLIPIGKKGGGVRPIAVGDTLRRLAGKLLLSRYQDEVIGKLAPEQMGVGVKRGAESIIHRLRSWCARAPPDHILLQLDFRNAFNLLLRAGMLQAIKDLCPGSSRTRWHAPVRPSSLFRQTALSYQAARGYNKGTPVGCCFSPWPSPR